MMRVAFSTRNTKHVPSMRLIALLTIPLWMAVGSVRADETGPDALVVVGEGVAALTGDVAAAEEEAVWDAKRNAVEQAAGIFLRARSVGRDFELWEDEIHSRADGFVQTWEIVPGSRRVDRIGNGKVLRLKVRAVVALLPVIRRLADIEDVYDDLERPRVRVEVAGDAPQRRAQNVLIAALKAQGFEIAGAGPAEIVLAGRLEATTTLRLGDHDSPYGVGELVGVCRARLLAQVVSTASEEILLTASAEGVGQSFQSDAEARSEAAAAAANSLLQDNKNLFAQHLLARWARERQEGHVVVVQVSGLNARERALLREQIRAMRGFRRLISETASKDRFVLRLLTRLDTRGVRRRLSSLRLNQASLNVLNDRGPLIVCAVGHRLRVVRDNKTAR